METTTPTGQFLTPTTNHEASEMTSTCLLKTAVALLGSLLVVSELGLAYYLMRVHNALSFPWQFQMSWKSLCGILWNNNLKTAETCNCHCGSRDSVWWLHPFTCIDCAVNLSSHTEFSFKVYSQYATPSRVQASSTSDSQRGLHHISPDWYWLLLGFYSGPHCERRGFNCPAIEARVPTVRTNSKCHFWGHKICPPTDYFCDDHRQAQATRLTRLLVSTDNYNWQQL